MRTQHRIADVVRRARLFSAPVAVLLLIGCSGGGSNGPTIFTVVPDAANNRVLFYNLPVTTDQSANIVLGQTDFTSATAGATASTMNNPASVAADKSGNIYVADNLNCRVTQFRPPFADGMSASLVFGQSTLDTAACPSSTSSTTLGNTTNGPIEVFGASLDSQGDLWVTDVGANRIVEYVPPFSSNGMPASVALGQLDLNSASPNQGGANPSATSLNAPGIAIFDRSGNLWVADFGNNRLLEYVPPFISSGKAAGLVLGQADFDHGAPNEGGTVAANTMFFPNAVAFDSSGNMWVADNGNNRVLKFKPPFTTNMDASLVLGQADFTQNSANQGLAAPTAATLSSPFQVAFDVSGNLYANDARNNRTLVFTPPFSNGMNASVVIGQPTFTSKAATTTATGQNFPVGVITVPPLF